MKIQDLLKDAYKEGMTVEEIQAALASVELPADQSAEIERLKKANSNLSSENAEWKRKHREALSEEEQKAQELAERMKQLEEQNAALLRESGVAKHKAKFLGMGYEEALANDAAVAMADGDMDKLFTYQQKHQEALEKKIRADALKGTPKPVPNKGDGSVTLESLRKMTPSERYEYSQKNPEEYKALYGGN
jgi:DNA-binding transcriptional MerR regulator